jgi:acetolactate synthase-1/3 small subunit
MNDRFTVGLLVTNQYGVLHRVAGLYHKRGYNIDSLAVGETENPTYSRMTIVSSGGAYIRTQMIRQLNKLYDVHCAALIDDAENVSVEHVLIKLQAGGTRNPRLTELVNEFGGKVVAIGDTFLTADVTGTPERMQAFVAYCKPLGILELCRSGTLALSGSADAILSIPKSET